MMQINIHVSKDWVSTLAKFNVYVDNISDAINKELAKTSKKIRYRMVASIKKSPPDLGKGYFRPPGYVGADMVLGKWPIHFASKEGNAPRSDYGTLLKGVRLDFRKNIAQVGVYTSRRINKHPYAIRLEEGTENMAARPFLEPAMDRSVRGIENRLLRKLSEIR